MAKSGRVCDVLFEDEEMPLGFMTIYADAGMRDTIVSVEGVRTCYKNCDEFTYHAYLDPRHDPQFVKTNIKIAVTGEPAPDPAPALDVEKVKALILRIRYNANSWGFHEAMAFDCDNADTRTAIQHIADGAKHRCRSAQTELFQLLGIEEE